MNRTQIEDLASRALALPESERDEFVRQACGRNATARIQVLGQISERAAIGQQLADLDLKAGDVLGDYSIVDKIGEGGMGAVFLGESTGIVKSRVAIKVVKLGMDTRDVLNRFAAESSSLSRMRHQNVATVMSAGSTATGRPYFVMEYVDGLPLDEYCDQNQLPMRERVALLRQACDGVNHGHERGIVHRDLKPANILVTEIEGQPVAKVIDFGIARTVAGSGSQSSSHGSSHGMTGTKGYASPEQMSGSVDVDARADIFSLGVVAFEILVGILPWEGLDAGNAAKSGHPLEAPLPGKAFKAQNSARETIAANRQMDAATLTKMLDGDLGRIVLQALEQRPDDRYSSVWAFSKDLERWLDGKEITFSARSTGRARRRFLRRNRVAVRVAGVLLVLLTATTAVSIWQFIKAREQQQLADSTVEVFFDLVESMDSFDRVDGRIDPGELIVGIADRLENRFVDHPLRRAEMLIDLADGYYLSGVDISRDLLVRAERILAAQPDSVSKTSLQAGGTLVRAQIESGWGVLDDGFELAEEALSAFTGIDDEIGVLDSKTVLAELHVMAGNYQQARQHYEEVATGARAIAELEDLVTYAELGLAQTSYSLGELEQSLQQMSRIEQSDGFDEGFKLAIDNLRAMIYADQGRYDESLALQLEEAERDRRSGETSALSVSMYNIAMTYADFGDLDRALDALEESIVHATANRESLDIHTSLHGHLLSLTGQNEEARKLAESAVIGIGISMGAESDWLGIARQRLIDTLIRSGSYAAARSNLDNMEPALETYFGESPSRISVQKGLKGELLWEAGDLDAGERLLRQSVAELQAQEVQGLWLRITADRLARRLVESGRSDEARTFAAMARSSFDIMSDEKT